MSADRDGGTIIQQGGVPEPGFRPLIKPIRRIEEDPAGATEDRPTANGELGEPAVGTGSAPALPDVFSGNLAAAGYPACARS